MAKQLNELEFRRGQVFEFLKQISALKVDGAKLEAEIRTQLALEKQAHEYTARELGLATERAVLYERLYGELKQVPPPSKGLSKGRKAAIIAGVIAAGAVIGYAVSR